MHARSFRRLATALTMALALLGPGAALAQPAPTVMVADGGDLGQILTDSKGMTLYLFTKDSPGTTNCYGGCATAWPPLMADGDLKLPAGVPGVLGTTPRTDGGMQVTYNGSPLYYWQNDHQPGDTTGENVGGVWFVLNPEDAPTVAMRSSDDMGQFLTDASGMSLYLFTKDSPGTTTCYDQCAKAWPPLLAKGPLGGPDEVVDGLGIVTRTDGTRQVTYQGWPLYYWQNDHQPGDTSGQNVGGVWFLISPDGAAIGQ